MMGKITYEGVTFVTAVCSAMSKEEFIRAHIDAFWTDKDIKARRKMLTEAYTLMVPETEEK